MSRILPILFNQEMVRAILDGRKTVTRRIVKRKGYTEKIHNARNDYACKVASNLYQIGYRLPTRMYPQESVGVHPQYQVGDRLYVRETFCKSHNQYFYKADNKCSGCTEDGTCLPRGIEKHITCELCENESGFIKWHPSIHMPKEAARIWLKVTDVRVERLQNITEEQARAEGCIDYHDKTGDGKFDDVLEFDLTARDAFVDLWNSTLKKDSEHTWAHNPWVWVYEFERCEKPD